MLGGAALYPSPMPDVVWSQPQVAATPSSYKLAGAFDFELLSVLATFDGSAAAATFLPTLQLLDPGGNVIASCTAQGVAAAGSATISWFPGLALSGETGIQFDIGNVGDWLEVDTTGVRPTTSSGIELRAAGGNIVIDTPNNILIGDPSALTGPNAINIQSGTNTTISANATLTLESAQTVTITAEGTGKINVAQGGDKLGFFGATPVVRQATPVTLADVIATGQVYGWWP